MMLGSVEIETMIYKLSLLIGEIIVGLDSGTIALVNLQTSPGCTINCSFVTVLKVWLRVGKSNL